MCSANHHISSLVENIEPFIFSVAYGVAKSVLISETEDSNSSSTFDSNDRRGNSSSSSYSSSSNSNDRRARRCVTWPIRNNRMMCEEDDRCEWDAIARERRCEVRDVVLSFERNNSPTLTIGGATLLHRHILPLPTPTTGVLVGVSLGLSGTIVWCVRRMTDVNGMPLPGRDVVKSG